MSRRHALLISLLVGALPVAGLAATAEARKPPALPAKEPAATAMPEPPSADAKAPPATAKKGKLPFLKEAKDAKDAPDELARLRARLAERLGAGPPVAPAKQHSLVQVVARGADEHGQAAGVARRVPARIAPAPKPAADPHAVHWAYAGDGGPKAWGALRPEFAKCANGARQSPVDIRGGFAVDLEPIQFDYKASSFRVLDNGHTVQVNLTAGNSIVVQGQRYELRQFHFHHPAEERIEGRSFDMSLHLVHQDDQGRLAVVALLLERGAAAQPVVQTVWNNLPLEKGEEIGTRAVVDLNHLLPPDRGYYTYMGSLTTPPCTEGVLWMVMRQPVPLASEQIALFARLYPMNARPLQQLAGRMIKQSN